MPTPAEQNEQAEQAAQAHLQFRDATAALRDFGFNTDGTLKDLNALDRRATPGFDGNKEAGKALLVERNKRLAELQELFYANAQADPDSRHSLLLVIQGMDTSGKGGVMRHVISAMDPQGVNQFGFKKPTEEELQHDFLWRVRKQLPRHGEIGVFDRSHYEDVLVHRVDELTPAPRLARRYGAIRRFEKELADNGTLIIKVMLHISPEEQFERLSARLDNPQKYWKFTPADVSARQKWPEYMEAHQIAIERTDTEEAPWFVIPADRKWYARLAVQHLLIERLETLDLQWPAATFDIDLERARLNATRDIGAAVTDPDSEAGTAAASGILTWDAETMGESLVGQKVAVLATNGVEESELTSPWAALEAVGAESVLVSPAQAGETITAMQGDWAHSNTYTVDVSLADARVEDFDGLVLPGGTLNADALRVNEDALGLVREFFAADKPVAAICHAPWILVNAGVISGRKVTSVGNVAEDVRNAGAVWVDEPVVVDAGLTTSRTPADLEAFNTQLLAQLAAAAYARAEAEAEFEDED